MADVAKAAGVSTMTVSNVLNNRREQVSPATRERVLELIRKLDYVPNAQARALAADKSGIVAVVYPGETPESRALSNPYHAEFVGAVEREVAKAKRHLLIRAESDVREIEAFLRTWRVDGAIFLGLLGEEAERLENASDMEMVFVDNYFPETRNAHVNIEDFDGGYRACKHLLEQGHRDIGFVGPRAADVGVIHEREEGVRAALKEHGLSLREDRRWVADTSFEDARSVGERIAADPPTALVATADITAIGVIRGLVGAGLRVPEDVSIVGFDDLEPALYSTPQLTTIRQDIQAKAHAAVSLLMDEINGVPGASERRVNFPIELKERQSVRRIGDAEAQG